jgi:hypothetical protein
MRRAVVAAASLVGGCGPGVTPIALPATSASLAASSPQRAAAAASQEETSARVGADRPADEVRYLKGQLHVHTANSVDSSTLPMDVVRWYERAGYDFIVVTDHNYTTEFAYGSTMLLITGAELTYNPSKCRPPPVEPDGRCRFHMNALFVPTPAPGEMPWDQPDEAVQDFTRLGLYQRHLDAIKRLGGLAQLNHPTWHWGVDGTLLAELARRGVTLVEIANQAFSSWNAGTDIYPGTEAIWDDALTRGAVLWGVASDDAHHYSAAELQARTAEGRPRYPPNQGWVMVRSRRDPQAIRDALVRGEFYSSTGVVLARAEIDKGALVIEVDASSPGTHWFRFIGAGGALLAQQEGRGARFPLAYVGEGYVRAVVADARGARAWVQPFRAPSSERGSFAPTRSP